MKETQNKDKQVSLQKYLIEQELDFIYQAKSEFWRKVQQRKMIELFKKCIKSIPAYRDFLKKSKVNISDIKTSTDFNLLSPINKTNYLTKYPWDELLMPDSLASQSLVLTSTSGSTGKPFYFPRNNLVDAQSSIYHQMFVRNSDIDLNKSTLVLVCFGMGVWVGGIITYQAFRSISERGYPMTILTPGINKKEIFEALKNVAPHYDQIIMCGYPPFMKDVVDEASSHDVKWKDYNIKMIFAAEAFSEKFRDYVIKKVGMKNVFRDIMNIYGSADLGTMAEETPISILIRRLALKNKNIYKRLFLDATRLPTFAQYIPNFINFECVKKNIFVTGDNILPLVRYEIGDNGGVISFNEVENIFLEEGIDLGLEAKKVKISDTVAELPFVYVYERTDFSTKLYGAIIYPEYIKAGLQQTTLQKYITGKFTIFTNHDKKQDEYIEVNVELKPKINESDWLTKEAVKHITEALLKKSAEYANNANMMPGKVKPRIVFWPHEHPKHFQAGIKQKWVKKE